MRYRILPFIALVLMATLVSCGEAEQNKTATTETHKPETYNNVLNAPGQYCKPAINVCIKLTEADNLVKFTVEDSAGKSIIQGPFPDIDKSQQYFAALDDQHTIWVYTAEQGLFVLYPKSGVYQIWTYGDITKENVKQIPRPVFYNLPESIRNKFE